MRPETSSHYFVIDKTTHKQCRRSGPSEAASSRYTLECGGPAPLWPVLLATQLRSSCFVCEVVSRSVARCERRPKRTYPECAGKHRVITSTLTKLRTKQCRRSGPSEAGSSRYTLECGGPAPLWPVLLATQLRSSCFVCEVVSRSVARCERRPKRCRASALQIGRGTRSIH